MGILTDPPPPNCITDGEDCDDLFPTFNQYFSTTKIQHWMEFSFEFTTCIKYKLNIQSVCVEHCDVYCTYLALFSFSPLDDKIS